MKEWRRLQTVSTSAAVVCVPDPTPENDSNEILTQVIELTCSGQTGRIHRTDSDDWGLAEEW
jgi:hypothetical protein